MSTRAESPAAQPLKELAHVDVMAYAGEQDIVTPRKFRLLPGLVVVHTVLEGAPTEESQPLTIDETLLLKVFFDNPDNAMDLPEIAAAAGEAYRPGAPFKRLTGRVSAIRSDLNFLMSAVPHLQDNFMRIGPKKANYHATLSTKPLDDREHVSGIIAALHDRKPTGLVRAYVTHYAEDEMGVEFTDVSARRRKWEVPSRWYETSVPAPATIKKQAAASVTKTNSEDPKPVQSYGRKAEATPTETFRDILGDIIQGREGEEFDHIGMMRSCMDSDRPNLTYWLREAELRGVIRKLPADKDERVKYVRTAKPSL